MGDLVAQGYPARTNSSWSSPLGSSSGMANMELDSMAQYRAIYSPSSDRSIIEESD
jgi:hypothetical protein